MFELRRRCKIASSTIFQTSFRSDKGKEREREREREREIKLDGKFVLTFPILNYAVDNKHRVCDLGTIK